MHCPADSWSSRSQLWSNDGVALVPYVDEERSLYSMPLVYKYQIVIRPQRQQNSSQIADGEIVFGTVLVNDDAFPGQGPSYPLNALASVHPENPECGG
jgi:hypothetical protein